jgi:hypothetical protein
MAVLRQLDLVVLALALVVFLLAGLSLPGYAAAAAAWLVQRAIKAILEHRAAASDDPRTVVGLTAGSMLARGWLVALTILLVGLQDNDAGLAAAVLVIVLFTLHFTVSLILRPLEQGPERRP